MAEKINPVKHQSCMIMHVSVLAGRNISKGWVSDFFHTPCPFVQLHMELAAESTHKTRHVVSTPSNPQWNETFAFYLDPRNENVLDVYLMDGHSWYGGTLGTISIRCGELVMGKTERRTLSFTGTSEVDVEIKIEFDAHPNLRYSLCLPTEEKQFRQDRHAKVFKVLQNLLREKAPSHISHVPTVAVLGSGGGFRAMIGFAGAYKALFESGVLDCTTYTGTLSGSSWYLSQLYSHPKWPSGSIAQINEELRNNVDHTFLWLLKPSGFVRYIENLLAKRASGMPVSFTDFFGYLVGDTLLKGRMTSRLSDQRSVVKDGAAPLPLYTCVHVKKDISARVFQEWVEFSPYEIGMPKYGIFLQSHLFASRFFMGKVTKQFEEPPLHYLQGIWGSAFCILFRRLLKNKNLSSPMENVRKEMESKLDRELKGTPRKRRLSTSSINNPKRRKLDGNQSMNSGNGPQESRSYIESLLETVCTSSRLSLLSTRTARAGVVFNPMRGLSLQKAYPFSPFTAKARSMTPVSAKDEFNDIFELHPTSEEYQYLVDAGLTFNSPYPLVLRPQRTVDVILSYDFSARPTDLDQPFKELKLAEKWARLNSIAFPPIDVSVWDPSNPKELYIFKHPTDHACPVILHFVLINQSFREYKAPGVKRETEEERNFANFDLFNDPASIYSTFKFTYTHRDFNRLSQLMEYNTLNHLSDIKSIIEERIELKQKNSLQGPKKFKLLPMKKALDRLKSKKFNKMKEIREEQVKLISSSKDIAKYLAAA